MGGWVDGWVDVSEGGEGGSVRILSKGHGNGFR